MPMFLCYLSSLDIRHTEDARGVSHPCLFALSRSEPYERQVLIVQHGRSIGTRCYGAVHEYTMGEDVMGASLSNLLQPVATPGVRHHGAPLRYRCLLYTSRCV